MTYTDVYFDALAQANESKDKQAESEEPDMNVVMVHFSDQLYQDNGGLRSHYENVYSSMEGYTLPEHWFELPAWMAVAAGMLPRGTDVEVHVVTNMLDSAEYLNNTSNNTVILGSVMDINRTDWLELVSLTPERQHVLGGYVDGNELLSDIHGQQARYNTVWVEDIDELTELFDGVTVQAEAELDYSIFAGERTIPRLTMSHGCTYGCNFCTIRNTKPIPMPIEDVKSQVDSWEGLEFELVYLDDKTFGQAPNWVWLGGVRDRILEYNPDFKGFIIQTTGTELLKTDKFGETKLERAVDMGVLYVEVGMEIIDDDILAQIQKPHRVKHLNELAGAVREQGISLIPNVLLCLPEANYDATETWIMENLDIIPACNFFNLAVYADSKGLGGDWMPDKKQDSDSDELSFERSWLTAYEQKHNVETQKDLRYLLEIREYLLETDI